MKNNKKIKIHVKNNHWAPGSFPTDAEGEKNFTITKEHLDEALKNSPEMRETKLSRNENNRHGRLSFLKETKSELKISAEFIRELAKDRKLTDQDSLIINRIIKSLDSKGVLPKIASAAFSPIINTGE